MSLVACALLLGPPGGMFPPYQERGDCCESARVFGGYPLPVSQLYADDGLFIWLWQPLLPQFPAVPLFKYVLTMNVHVGAVGAGGPASGVGVGGGVGVPLSGSGVGGGVRSPASGPALPPEGVPEVGVGLGAGVPLSVPSPEGVP